MLTFLADHMIILLSKQILQEVLLLHQHQPIVPLQVQQPAVLLAWVRFIGLAWLWKGISGNRIIAFKAVAQIFFKLMNEVLKYICLTVIGLL